MTINKFHIILSLVAAAVPAAVAQELHEQIGVDGKYVREVTVQDRIHLLPTRLRPQLETRPMPYNFDAVTTDFFPVGAPLNVVTPYADRTTPDSPGYLALSLGSWLDGNLSAGYRFVRTPATTAGAYLQFNTTSYFKPKLAAGAEDVRRELADGRLGVYASHNFDGKGTLSGNAEYRLGWWNYFGYADLGSPLYRNPDSEAPDAVAPTQTLNEVNARIGWEAQPNTRGFSYKAAVAAHYFGYRSMYERYSHGSYEPLKTPRETRLSFSGALAKRWQSGSSLGIDLALDGLFYSHPYKLDGYEGYFRGWESPDNYGMLTLTPYYRFSHGLLNIRIGADIDLSFNAGPEGDRYSAFHIAPDVRLDWRKGGFGLFLNLLGGSQLQTLAYLHSLDYYCMPGLPSTRPVYTPFDGEAGVGIGPFAGFSARLAFRYRVSRNTSAGGWYMAMLNYGLGQVPGLMIPDGATTSDYSIAYSQSPQGINLHGLGLAVDLDYRLGSILHLKAAGTYQPQDGKTGYFNGYDRPRWTLAAGAEVRLVKPLTIAVEYQYRGVRNIYTPFNREIVYTTVAPASLPVISEPDTDDLLGRLRLPDLTLLSARIGWQFTPRISAFVSASNLLNRRDDILPCTPLSGISVIAGAQFLF